MAYLQASCILLEPGDLREAETGLAVHRAVPIDEFPATLDSPAQGSESTMPGVPLQRLVWDWAAANDKKNAAITALAPLADLLDDIDARINELAARGKQLEGTLSGH